ncbi:transglutaminase-like putative cysteine protease [Sphingomonas kaistensis]|uniref:Transglutaminase-like putative cysteine protease n=1 Tax=Sphingomonas kaistensis TaxID=298708 RepID=A0A7X5Y8B0_9SPHN|nr:transglutaminase family protein [Sphingomonas kaistensis]NJC05740.1 transglutaminase-like putative cysteine protease [Sphingomonas kaistensis]
MRLTINHRTRYRFSRPLTNAVQILRLTPLSCLNQTVLDWRIDVDCDARLRESRDGYGNCVTALYVDDPVTSLTITANGEVVTDDRAGVVSGLPSDLPPGVFLRPTALTTPDEALRDFAAEIAARVPNPLARLHTLSASLSERMQFEIDTSIVSTTAADAFEAGRGVCQDYAHIFIAAAREGNIPARYVSGHLYRRDGAGDQPASHAWTEAWVDDLGWVAFDPTNGICADDAYVRVASGLDFTDVSPIVGARRGGGEEQMTVEVRVTNAARRRQSQRQGSRGSWQEQSQG